MPSIHNRRSIAVGVGELTGGDGIGASGVKDDGIGAATSSKIFDGERGGELFHPQRWKKVSIFK